MLTYLVTGGAGFIGSNYIHYMFKKYDKDIRIINVDVLTYAGNLENLKDVEGRDNYTFVKANICDREAINKIFEENDIDRVVHFAAESHVDRSIVNPEIFAETNVLGTAIMLNAAKKAWELPDGSYKEGMKFLHVSTDEVYGSLPEDPDAYFYETTPYDPHSPYSASKASSDMFVKGLSHFCAFNLSGITIVENPLWGGNDWMYSATVDDGTTGTLSANHFVFIMERITDNGFDREPNWNGGLVKYCSLDQLENFDLENEWGVSTRNVRFFGGDVD
nr:GDP-mannose 4,6-dehydratase [Butyrivibrio sp. XPD2002]